MILSNKIAYFASPLDNCGTSYRVNSSLKLVPIKLEFNFTLQQIINYSKNIANVIIKPFTLTITN